jgi:hypothetical protein
MPFGKTMFGKNFEFLPDFPEFTSVFWYFDAIFV